MSQTFMFIGSLLSSFQLISTHVTDEGYWFWNSKTNDSIEISLTEDSKGIYGSCCIVFLGGQRIDCSDTPERTIVLEKINSTIYEGYFISSYFDRKIPVRLVFSVNKKDLTVQFLNNENQNYNFPEQITLLSN